MTQDHLALEATADTAAAGRRFADAAALLGRAAALAPDRAEIWSKLSAMRRASGDLAGALQAIDKTLAIAPLDFSALLGRALLMERLEPGQAGNAFCEAIAQLREGEDVPQPMQAAVAHASAQCAKHRSATKLRLARAVPHDLAEPERNRLNRFVSNVSRETVHHHQQPTHFHFPGLPEIEFHHPDAFAGLKRLAGMTDIVRQELEALLAAEGRELVPYIQYPERIALRQWQELNQNDDWSAFHLLQNGARVEANARHCPQTLAALAELDQPQVPGASPNAMFSLLAPKTRIPPHSGVANTRLVAHLPLVIPPECGFRCGATTVEWKLGEPFVFDDTIEHEAWNNSDQLRIVLIFDLWVPELSIEERAGVAAIIGMAEHGQGGI